MNGLKRAFKKKARLVRDHIVDATVPTLGPRPSNPPAHHYLYQQPVVNSHQPTAYAAPSALAYPVGLPAQPPSAPTSLPPSQLPSPAPLRPGMTSTSHGHFYNEPQVPSNFQYDQHELSSALPQRVEERPSDRNSVIKHFLDHPAYKSMFRLGDLDRAAVEQQRHSPYKDLMPNHPFLPSMTPEDIHAVSQLESQQAAIAGPKWQIGNVMADMKLKMHGFNGPMAAALSGLEDGTRFARENRRRYDEVGNLVLDTVRKGLSRVLDLSKGVSEIIALQDEVNAAALSYEGDDSIFGVTVADITDSTVPIFVVSYRHCVFEQSWRMSEAQIKELFVILSMLTDGGKLRLWFDRILPEKLSRTLRWEAIGLLPYTMFPVIALGCHSTFVGEAADD